MKYKIRIPKEAFGTDAAKFESREKYWKELKYREKMERMRNVIKDLQQVVMELSKEVGALRNHRHDGTDIVIPLNRGYLEGQSPRERGDDEVYF